MKTGPTDTETEGQRPAHWPERPRLTLSSAGATRCPHPRDAELRVAKVNSVLAHHTSMCPQDSCDQHNCPHDQRVPPPSLGDGATDGAGAGRCERPGPQGRLGFLLWRPAWWADRTRPGGLQAVAGQPGPASLSGQEEGPNRAAATACGGPAGIDPAGGRQPRAPGRPLPTIPHGPTSPPPTPLGGSLGLPQAL